MLFRISGRNLLLQPQGACAFRETARYKVPLTIRGSRRKTSKNKKIVSNLEVKSRAADPHGGASSKTTMKSPSQYSGAWLYMPPFADPRTFNRHEFGFGHASCHSRPRSTRLARLSTEFTFTYPPKITTLRTVR